MDFGSGLHKIGGTYRHPYPSTPPNGSNGPRRHKRLQTQRRTVSYLHPYPNLIADMRALLEGCQNTMSTGLSSIPRHSYPSALSIRELLYELTATAIALSLVLSGIVIELVSLQHNGQVVTLPEWQSIAIGTVVGYYLTRGQGGSSRVAPHVHPDGVAELD